MPREKISREKNESRELRTHCVSSRFSPSELAALDERRGKIPRGEYVRRCTFGTPPVPIPEPNTQKYAELARVAGNINQLARAVNMGGLVDVGSLVRELGVFRMRLLGITWGDEIDESEDC